jgi:hypothetical protein
VLSSNNWEQIESEPKNIASDAVCDFLALSGNQSHPLFLVRIRLRINLKVFYAEDSSSSFVSARVYGLFRLRG